MASSTVKPTPKMAAAAVGGTATALVIWLFALAGIEIPETAAGYLAEVLLPAIGAFVAGWLKRDASSPPSGVA